MWAEKLCRGGWSPTDVEQAASDVAETHDKLTSFKVLLDALRSRRRRRENDQALSVDRRNITPKNLVRHRSLAAQYSTLRLRISCVAAREGVSGFKEQCKATQRRIHQLEDNNAVDKSFEQALELSVDELLKETTKMRLWLKANADPYSQKIKHLGGAIR